MDNLDRMLARQQAPRGTRRGGKGGQHLDANLGLNLQPLTQATTGAGKSGRLRTKKEEEKELKDCGGCPKGKDLHIS